MPVRRCRQDDGRLAVELLDDGGEPVEVVSAFLCHLAARDYSPNTQVAYAHDLQHLWRFFTSNGLTWETFQPTQALDLLADLRAFSSPYPVQRLGLSLAETRAGQPTRRLAPKTINRILAAVSSFYEFTIIAGLYPNPNPLEKIPDARAPRLTERHRPFLGGGRLSSCFRPWSSRATPVTVDGGAAMRAGAVSAAALAAHGPTTPPLVPQHCSAEVYRRFVTTMPVTQAYRNQLLAWRRHFVERWPQLHIWFAAPLSLRVGRLPSERRVRLTDRICYQARGYLVFLALRGYIRLDYAWLLGAGHLYTERLALHLGIDLGIEALAADAVRLGFNRIAALAAMRWCVGRIALHTGLLDATEFGVEHIEELLAAIRQFGERPDLPAFYQSLERYRVSNLVKIFVTSLRK